MFLGLVLFLGLGFFLASLLILLEDLICFAGVLFMKTGARVF